MSWRDKWHAWRTLGKVRCEAAPPWRLIDASPCICPRGHQLSGCEGAEWHGDGNGFIWNNVTGQWRWMGGVVNVADEYSEPPSGSFIAVFTDWPE